MPSLVDQIVAAISHVAGPAAPLHAPEIAGNEWPYVKECLDTEWVSSVGSYVDRFESDLAAKTGAKYAIATMNGTAALHGCMVLAGVGHDQEVIVPALTFVATANAVSYLGAVPHFVDSELVTLGVDPAKLDGHLDEIAERRSDGVYNSRTGRKIAAVICMHTFGHPVRIDALLDVTQKWNLPLIEDAAESLGSYFKGRHTGTFGKVSALSFNGNKIITTGGGGAILTDNPNIAARAKHLTTTAKIPHLWAFEHDDIGYNYRLPNINAALGCAQLERLEDFLARKRRVADAYTAAFLGVDGVRIVLEPDHSTSNMWLNAILLAPENSAYRNPILDMTNESGLMTRPVWNLMHTLPMYAECPRADLSTAEQLASCLITLPSSPSLAA